MHLRGIFVVASLVCELSANPTPLQGFALGDQTTGSKWPPYENAGKDYWSLQAENINLNEDKVDDVKDIVKKEVEEEQPIVNPAQDEIQPQVQPAPPPFQSYSPYTTNRGLYTFFNTRGVFSRNPYRQLIF